MNLLQLQYFQVLAKVLHYTKTSQILHISQPTLSYAISRLEKELGVVLFIKGKKQITLSPCGENFLGYVNQSMDILDKGVRTSRLIKKSSISTVSIGHNYTLSFTVIPKIIESCKLETEGKIKLKFMQNAHKGLMLALLKGLIDFAISAGKGPDIFSVPLLEQELFAIVPKKHPLAQRKTITFQEIIKEPFIISDVDSALWKFIANKFSEHGVSPVIAGETKECNAALEYVAQNDGITIIPDIPATNNKSVAKIKIVTPGFKRDIYLSWSKDYVFTPTTISIRNTILKLYLKNSDDVIDHIDKLLANSYTSIGNL